MELSEICDALGLPKEYCPNVKNNETKEKIMSKLEGLKELLSLLGDSKQEPLKSESKAVSSRLQVGKNYLIRTVTMIQVGEFVEFDDRLNAIILKNASWIPDTGRFHDCLKNGTFSEVEPIPEWVGVGIGSIIDLVPFNHSSLIEQK